jgi:hypothetical protein
MQCDLSITGDSLDLFLSFFSEDFVDESPLAKEGIVHITRISGEKPRPSLSHSLSDREKALLSAYLDYSNFYRELAQAEAKQHRRRPILRRADLIEQSSTL